MQWLTNLLNFGRRKETPLTAEQKDLLQRYTLAWFQASVEPGNKDNPFTEVDNLRKELLEKGVPLEKISAAQHDAANFGTPGMEGGKHRR